MTQTTQKPVDVRRVDKYMLLKQLLKNGSGNQGEPDPIDEELQKQDSDLDQTDIQEGGRPKTKKWVLLH